MRHMSTNAIPTLGRFMKSAVLNNVTKKMEVLQLARPTPKGNQILIKMRACGCCHTDIHAIDGDWGVKPKPSLCPGHEGVGTVVEVGPNASNFKVGDMAGMAWLHSACGNCEYCNSGWETLCERQTNTGYGVDGAYSSYALAADSHAIKIPDGLDPFQAAPILCAGVTSYKALKCTETKPGQFVAIVGAAGGLGHLAIQYAKAMGMQVVAVDQGQEKLDYCKSLGADYVVDARQSTVPGSLTPAQLVHQCSHGGCHGVLCLATQKAAFANSIAMTRRNGTMVCVGLPSGTFEVPVVDIVLGGITIRGSIVGTRQDAAEALDFGARGLVKCNVEKAKLDDVTEVLQRVRENKVEGRIVFEF